MTTSLRRKHRDRVVRRGLGLLIESDFYATERLQAVSHHSLREPEHHSLTCGPLTSHLCLQLRGPTDFDPVLCSRNL